MRNDGNGSTGTVVLGLGNLLLADEGFGVHAAQALIEAGGTDGAEVFDIGTAVLDAIPALERAERVIVLDAVKAGEKPGTVYRVPFGDMKTTPCIASVHGFDIRRALALAGREKPPEMIVIGVEPARIAWSLDLSPEVKHSIPLVLDEVRSIASTYYVTADE